MRNALGFVFVAGVWVASLSAIAPTNVRAEKDEHGHDEGHENEGEEKEHSRKDEKRSATPALTDDLAKKLGIPVSKAQGGSVDTYVALFGKVELHPERSVHLHPKYAGIVRDVFKSTGDNVNAGDVLARIENNVGVQTYDLVSAIRGRVLERRIASGQSVNEDIEAFTVADTSVVLISLVAYARDLSRLRVGQKVILHSSSNGDDFTPHDISYISPLLDDRTRTAEAHVIVQNEGGRWRPGQFVIGKVAVGTKDVAVKLPRSVVPGVEANSTTVFVKEKTAYVRRDVKIGLSDANSVEINSGMLAGDEYLDLNVEAVESLLKEKGPNASEG